jgi:hypothetical protein
VKPVPIIVITLIMAEAFRDTSTDVEMAIADLFLLFLPGKYTGTMSDDAAFKLQDVHLYIQGRQLYSCLTSTPELISATSVSYTSTRQKHGNRKEKIVHGFSGDP